MNTDVAVEGTEADLRPWFAEVEQSLSRFQADSDLSRLNRLAGRWVLVSDMLFDAVARALAAAAMTGGAFDPTILPALEAAGYGQSFDLGPTPAGPAAPAGRWREVKIDHRLKAVRLPEGVRLDLGGIGKGLAVDGAMVRLAGEPGLLVNAGGDLAVRTAPGDEPIIIDVEDPLHFSRTLASFALHSGAVATSSTMGRRWGDGQHHIIDPRTGRPSDSGIVAVTVVGTCAVRAEVLAKACIVLGRAGALQLLEREHCHGLLVDENGAATSTPGLEGVSYAGQVRNPQDTGKRGHGELGVSYAE
jgi:FAD:protein FMN transferase